MPPYRTITSNEEPHILTRRTPEPGISVRADRESLNIINRINRQ